jgi:hypothetical protein
MLDLAAAKRATHGVYQPVFWRAAESASVMQDLWFRFLLTSDDHHLLVATEPDGRVVGFLIAQVMDAPPVYDPGGRTCMVDDFVAAPGEAFDGLVAAARSWAASSISLCRHSDARYTQAMRAVRCTRRRSPYTNA